MVNAFAKYKRHAWNNGKSGIEGGADRQTDGAGHENTLRLEGENATNPVCIFLGMYWQH